VKAGLLSWSEQVSAHAAYIAAHAAALASPDGPSAPKRHGKRRSPESAECNREALLDALRDGRPHPFRDLRAALPDLSLQGIYYLVNALGAEGQITVNAERRMNHTYQLGQRRSP
jgi:hypothetical protein